MRKRVAEARTLLRSTLLTISNFNVHSFVIYRSFTTACLSQVSQQCMEMVAEGVISPCKHLGHVAVNPTFTAIVEGREAKEVSMLCLLRLCSASQVRLICACDFCMVLVFIDCFLLLNIFLFSLLLSSLPFSFCVRAAGGQQLLPVDHAHRAVRVDLPGEHLPALQPHRRAADARRHQDAA